MMLVLTLDQIQVFLAVVDAGSFSAAAKTLGRVQSAVSYGIDQLEVQLGVSLFDRSGYRPVLSPAGEALLSDAMALRGAAQRLSERASWLSAGEEARVSLIVDVLFPMGLVVKACADLQADFPQLAVDIRSESLGSVADGVLRGDFQLGIGGHMDQLPSELSLHKAPSVETRMLCASCHRLASLKRVGPAAFEAEVQIVLTDPTERTKGRSRGVLSPRVWRVSDLHTKLELLRAGCGFGTMPLHLARPYLEEGSLVAIEPVDVPSGLALPMFAFTLASRPLGPGARELLARLTGME